MAVDPDHFRHGYGSVLCRHGMDMRREDKVPVDIIAAKMGTYLYNSLGFNTTVRVGLRYLPPDSSSSSSRFD